MDNKREALLMIDASFQKEVAREHVQGICKYFGVPFKELKEVVEEVKGVTKGIFRIKTGTFPSARAFADAVEKFKNDFGMLIYEAAEEAEAKIKVKYGWTIYLIDETK